MIKRIAKILMYILTTIIGLLVILLLLVHRGTFNAYISGVITTQVNNTISGELAMEPFSGSLFNDFTLHNVKVQDADTMIIDATDIHIRYSLVNILRKRLLIRAVELDTIVMNATRYNDSTWNVLKVFEPVEPRSPDNDTTGDGFLKEIEISKFHIGSLQLNVNSGEREDIIPAELDGAIELRFRSAGDDLFAELTHFELQTRTPDLNVRRLTGAFSLQSETLQWDSLRLSLTETELFSSGNMPLKNISGADVEMIFSPLAFSDIRPFMTGDTLYGSPDISINYGGEEDKKQVMVRIATMAQSVALEGWIEGMTDEDSYYLQLFINDFDGSAWTGDAQMKTLITGNMEIEGTGYDLQTNRLNVSGNYDTISYADYAADTLIISVKKNAGDASGMLELSSNRGGAISNFSLTDIFNTMHYDFTSELSGIDISDFFPASEINSDLNLNLEARGNGFDPKTMKTYVFLKASNSFLLNKPVDQFEIKLNMNDGIYDFHELSLQTPYFMLYADGEGDIYSDNFISLQFEPYDLNPLLTPFGIPDVQLNGRLTGTLSGYMDSLNLDAVLAFDSLAYDTIKASNFYSDIYLNLHDSTYNGTVDLRTGRITYGDIQPDSLHLTSDFSRTMLDNNLFVRLNDSVQSDLNFIVETGEVPVIYLKGIQLALNESVWSGGSDSAYIALGKDTIQVNEFMLNNGVQSITADGGFAFNGKENFKVAIRNLDLEEVGTYTPFPKELHGTLSSDIMLLGDARKPDLKGNIQVSAPGYQEIDFSHFEFDFDYEDELLVLGGILDDKTKQRFYADVAIPLHLSFSDSIYLLNNQAGFHADIRIDSLNTKLFNPYLTPAGIQSEGFISSQASVSNTLSDPVISGGFKMQDGRIDIEDPGVIYKDILMDGSFSGERISLGSLKIYAGKGYLEASGYADIALLTDQKLKNINVQINAKDFKAIDGEKGSAVINSKLSLSGPYNSAKVDGQLTILQSTINTDALLAEQSMKTANPNPPLLVKAMQDTILRDSLTIEPPANLQRQVNTGFYDNMSGSFIVRVPGNTWVKGKDMNFELNGELRAVKEGPQIDLFGDLNVNRGFYKFYGKRFSFNRGNLTFTGGSEINPQVDFEVVYSFRDEERELRKLKLFLTGRALNPDIRFTLDGQFVEEKDAIAYLLFGRRMDNLTAQQSTSVEQSAINLSRDIALGQVSNLLKDALQSTLRLDVVEVSGGESWQSGSVTIGKYITNDLYVRYEQNFAFDKKNKVIEPEEIALEYQIIRSLFLQATNQRENSGFDLIFKKEWK